MLLEMSVASIRMLYRLQEEIRHPSYDQYGLGATLMHVSKPKAKAVHVTGRTKPMARTVLHFAV